MIATTDSDSGSHRGETGGTLVLVFDSSSDPARPSEHAGWFVDAAGQRPGARAMVVHDPQHSAFYRGADGLGGTIDEVARALRGVVAGREPSVDTLITCGAGAGGHAALVLGILLGAARVVAAEPPAHLIADELELYHDLRWARTLAALPDPAEARRFDVSALLATTGWPGRAFVLLGTGRGNAHHDAVHQNAIHAHRLACSDRVVLSPFPEAEQDVLGWLAQRGAVRDVLSRYLFDEVPVPARRPPGPDPARLQPSATRRRHRFTYQVCPAAPGVEANGTGPAYAAAGEPDVAAAAAARSVDDDWRRWIAGNLMLGASPAGLEETLVAHGIVRAQAAREVRKALESPYLWGAQPLQGRLRKLDWLLASYRKLRRLNHEAARVERRRRLPPDELLAHYAADCRPVILDGLLDDWPATAWTLDTLACRLGAGELTAHVVPGDGSPHDLAEVTLTAAELVERLRQAEARVDPWGFPGKRPVVFEENGALFPHGEDHGFLFPQGGDHEYLEPHGEALFLVAGESTSGVEALWDDLGPIAGYVDGPDRRRGTLRVASHGSTTPFELNLACLLTAQVLGETWLKLVPPWDLPLMDPTRRVISELDVRTVATAPEPPPGRPQALECRLGPGDILFLPAGWWSCHRVQGTSATVSYHAPAVRPFGEAEPVDTSGWE